MSRRRRGETGFSLVVMLYLILFTHIAVAAAMPLWSKAVQRDKEEETIFRALQYAEAIRIFQTRFGRAPNSLEELLEVKPRSIRQLYPNPMTESGEWGLLLQAAAQGAPNRPGQPGQPGQGDTPGQPRQPDPSPPGAPPGGGADSAGQPGVLGITAGTRPTQVVAIPPAPADDFGRRRQQRTSGPIVGVWPGIEGDSARSFAGRSRYEEWHFRVDLIPIPAIVNPGAPLPRANSGLIGRPFREGLAPQGGQVPGARQQPGRPGQELVPGRRQTTSPGGPSSSRRFGDRQ